MKQPSRRRAPARSRKQTGITPAKIRAAINDIYDSRQMDWSIELCGEEEEIDWSYLLGLHLQMCELEHLQRTLEEIAG
jgi:hypothetical protein